MKLCPDCGAPLREVQPLTTRIGSVVVVLGGERHMLCDRCPAHFAVGQLHGCRRIYAAETASQLVKALHDEEGGC